MNIVKWKLSAKESFSVVLPSIGKSIEPTTNVLSTIKFSNFVKQIGLRTVVAVDKKKVWGMPNSRRYVCPYTL